MTLKINQFFPLTGIYPGIKFGK